MGTEVATLRFPRGVTGVIRNGKGKIMIEIEAEATKNFRRNRG